MFVLKTLRVGACWCVLATAPLPTASRHAPSKHVTRCPASLLLANHNNNQQSHKDVPMPAAFEEGPSEAAGGGGAAAPT